MAKRRVKVTKSATPKEDPKTQVGYLADEAIFLMREVASHTKRLKEIHEKAFEIMARNGLQQVVSDEGRIAEQFTPAGRSTSTIDPKVFFAQFPEDDKSGFFDAVKVGITKAKEVLPTRVVTQISTVTPATIKEPEVRFYVQGEKRKK